MARLLFKQNKIKKSKDDSKFHIAIAPVIAMAQCFSMFPVVGIFSKDAQKIRFKFLSFRTFMAASWFVSVIIFLWFEILRIASYEKINAKNVSSLIFYIIGTITAINFYKLAFKWNNFMQLNKEVEDIFLSHPYSLSGWSLKMRIRVTAFLIMMLALIEHLFSWYSYLYERIYQAEVCKWEIGSWFYYILSLHLSHIYLHFPVNIFTVTWAEYMNISLTFSWSFIDLFIMLMAISISSRFKMLNERLDFFKGRIVTDEFWDNIRCHYNKLCELNENVDKILGNLICIASLSDLYYVCLQLLNVATRMPFFANKIYFWYSLIFLICRTFTLFILTAQIHDESIKSLAIYRTLPTEGWFNSTQRLCEQIQRSGVALSGKNFFFLTRGLIISIAGTIITYELVLLQFDNDKIVSDLFNITCPH
ncbi:hypothetical protein PVAND_011686 [Polypedilum vanderplanki]|uniref:Gustatory receptor n=1 Tax=Polypedilum vanderplanki TaxID=319348 RepID=A0A9J6CKD5_POLVA|nr:hypothetical protein PVAND_011686 [Polypedilum vanderplanki]